MTELYGPLEIPGFTLVRELGSGGFADVFLYDQEMPRRQVAVKIMRQKVADPNARAQFESEANLMAALSTHPSIVTIHYAAVASSGRPYLVMEYCSRPGLAQRYQQRVLTVPEMLQTMIRLCGAVETAHRAGILHRDIKPANVLTTDYGWPALTDFGISAVVGEATYSGGGLSLPWSAPEVVMGGKADARSDVYSLAATAYTVLSGASPFDLAGGPGEINAFVGRILTMPPPAIARKDVPEPLQRTLALALAKNPDDRPQSASELARSLQRIEQDMRLPVTHMDVPNRGRDGGATELDDDSESTRMSGSRSGLAPSAEAPPLAGSAVVTAVPEPTTPPLSNENFQLREIHDEAIDEVTRAVEVEAALRADVVRSDAATVGGLVEDFDEHTHISERLDERTQISQRDATEAVDELTRVSNRGTAEELDERTNILSSLDEQTRVVEAERTQFVAGHEDSDSTSDSTNIADQDKTALSKGAGVDSRTRVSGNRGAGRGKLRTSQNDVPIVPRRTAVVPGVDAGLQQLYRVRSAELTDAIPRHQPSPTASAKQYDDGQVVERSNQRRRGSARRRVMLLAAVFSALVVFVGVGIVLLINLG